MKLKLILLLFLINSKTFAQTYQWAKGFGGGNWDDGLAIAVDSHGNIYSTGRFQDTTDFDPGPGIYNLISVGAEDIFISKLDSTGNFLWAVSFGSTPSDGGHTIIVDSQDNILVQGWFNYTVDFDPGPSTYNLSTSSFSSHTFILKLDPNGNFIRAGCISGTSTMALDASGNIYLTGYFNNNADLDPGAGVYTVPAYGMADICIVKLDSLFNFIWGKSFGGVLHDVSNSIAIDETGYIYLAGSFDGTTDFDPGPGTYSLTSTNSADGFVSKFDTSGNFIWAFKLGGMGYDYATSVAVDLAGNIYAAGRFIGVLDFDAGPGVYNVASIGGGYNMYYSKYDTNGNMLWANCIARAEIKSLALDNSANLYTIGTFGSTDFDPGPGIDSLFGGADVFISKLDSGGNFLWAKGIGGNGSDNGSNITVDNFGSIYVTGFFSDTADFNAPNNANLISLGESDIFVAKYSQTISGISENNFSNFLNVYPNPTQNYVTVNLKQPVIFAEVVTTNVLGHEISRQIFHNTAQLIISIEGMSGLYFLHINTDDRSFVAKVIKS